MRSSRRRNAVINRGHPGRPGRVWLALVAKLRTTATETTSDAFVDAHAASLSRDAVLSHYSRERLMSVRARSIYVDPDLAPLP
jgi:hypothetical protein